jgi:predicted DNA-binding transcriptional regulator AlpA
MGHMKQYLTVKELADYLHVCRASVYNYLKTVPGFPQPVKVGRLRAGISKRSNFL